MTEGVSAELGLGGGARPAVTLVGDQWSPECSVLRTFLTRSEVAYTWLRPGDPLGAQVLTEHGLAAADTPVLIDAGGGAASERRFPHVRFPAVARPRVCHHQHRRALRPAGRHRRALPVRSGA